MIAHVSLPVTSYARAKKFYAKALAPVGYKLTADYPKWKAGGYKEGGNTSFWISEKKKMTPTHIAFEAKNKKQVDGFYKAALKAGGKDNGKPGYRTDYWPGYYAAFVYDKDGNNIEAVWFDYNKVKGKK